MTLIAWPDVAGFALSVLVMVAAFDLATAQGATPAKAPDVVPRDQSYGAVQLPDGIREMPAITYASPQGFRPLTLDLYLPAAGASRHAPGVPLVIFIHGGGWLGGDARTSSPFLLGALFSLAGKGYAVASINYRLSAEARFPAQAQDVEAAIRFLRLHAGAYGLDPARMLAWGVSAGGQLAALADVDCHRSAASVVPPRASGGGADATSSSRAACLQGAVAWYGVFDMATITEQARRAGAMSRDTADAPEWQLLGCLGAQCRPEQIKAASPLAFVRRDTPPMLVIAGGADTTVPTEQTTEMAARFHEVGAGCEVVILPKVGHGFAGTTPGETNKANLKAFAITSDFIERTIGPANP